jgi:hypothetical protein
MTVKGAESLLRTRSSYSLSASQMTLLHEVALLV